MHLVEKVRQMMGTEITISVVDLDCGEAIEAAFNECARIEKTYSRFLEGNSLAVLNESLGKWVEVDEELYDLILWGKNLGEETEGAFDLTVRNVLEGWGYDAEYSFKERKSGGLGEIKLKDGKEVFITSAVDLGAMGKGYAVDKMAECLAGFDNFCVNAGGDIFAKGKNELGGKWKVFFEHPVKSDEAIGFVEVDGFAVACSNTNKRKWGDKHHLVDPKTLKPANEMLAVYTQAENALWADSYATALFVVGYEGAKKLVEDLSIEVMLVSKEGKIFKSKNFKGQLYMVS